MAHGMMKKLLHPEGLCHKRRLDALEGPESKSYTGFACQLVTFTLSQSQPQVTLNPADPVLLVPTPWGDWI